MKKEDSWWINPSVSRSGKLNADVREILESFESSLFFHRDQPEYSPSPLYRLSGLAKHLGIAELFLKNEGERYGISAVKMLGASYAMHVLYQRNPGIIEFCTATDGNHGRSVAWTALRLKVRSCIFVPEYTVESRISAMEAEDARVVRVRGDYDDAVMEAKAYAGKTGAVIVQDMAWEHYEEIPALITAGYYTQMNELMDQLPEPVDFLIIQSGNGTWPSSVCHFARNHSFFRDKKIILVEPREADCMLESLICGSLASTRHSLQTLMAGLNCGTPSSLAWKILRKGIDASIAIGDEYSIEAMRMLYKPSGDDALVEAGESGAAGLAGLLAILREPEFENVKKRMGINEQSKVLLFNTEGITDPVLFDKLIL